MGLSYFYLRNRRDNDVVDFRDGKDLTTLVSAPPNREHPNSQLLEFNISETPPYLFIANRYTGQVIDAGTAVPGQDLINYSRNAPGNTSNQIWTLVPSDETEDYFFIVSKVEGAGVITVAGERNRLGTPLRIAARITPPAASQLWSIEKVG